jgi:hypothetical protein
MECIATLAVATDRAGDSPGAKRIIEEAVALLLDGGDVSGAAYPFRIYASSLDLLDKAHDPRYERVLAQANSVLDEIYPDGGCLPWMREIRERAHELP